MDRRNTLASIVCGLTTCSAGCSKNAAPQSNDRVFNDFLLVNKRRERVRAAVEITRNAETAVETDIEVPAADAFDAGTKQVIDRLERRTGTFEVTITTRDGEVTIPVTAEAQGDTYSLIVVIESDEALHPYVSQ